MTTTLDVLGHYTRPAHRSFQSSPPSLPARIPLCVASADVAGAYRPASSEPIAATGCYRFGGTGYLGRLGAGHVSSIAVWEPLKSFAVMADRGEGEMAYTQSWTGEVSDALLDVHLGLEELFGADGTIDDAEHALLSIVRRANERVGEVDRNIREHISVLRTGSVRPHHERQRRARRTG